MVGLKVFIKFLECFHCSVHRISPGQVENNQLFVILAGLRSQYSKRNKHVGTSSFLFLEERGVPRPLN